MHEAVDLRDGGQAFGGMGVSKAVANVNNEISRLLLGRNALRQAEIDEELIACDGTRDKSRLGGNAMIATSMAVLPADAAAPPMPLHAFLSPGENTRMPLAQTHTFRGR